MARISPCIYSTAFTERVPGCLSSTERGQITYSATNPHWRGHTFFLHSQSIAFLFVFRPTPYWRRSDHVRRDPDWMSHRAVECACSDFGTSRPRYHMSAPKEFTRSNDLKAAAPMNLATLLKSTPHTYARSKEFDDIDHSVSLGRFECFRQNVGSCVETGEM